MKSVRTAKSIDFRWSNALLVCLMFWAQMIAVAQTPPDPLNSTPSTTPVFTPQQLMNKMGANRSSAPRSLTPLPFQADANYPAFYVLPQSRRALVMDQGDCGACVAYATSAALTTILTQRPEILKATFPTRAGIMLMDSAYLLDPMSLFRKAGRDCHKGEPNYAWNVPEAARFVRANNNAFGFSGTLIPDVTISAGKIGDIDDNTVLPAGVTKIDAMRSYISRQGALVSRMNVYPSFNYYKSGIYNNQKFNAKIASFAPFLSSLLNQVTGGHAITVIGYFKGGRLKVNDLIIALYGGDFGGVFAKTEVDAPAFWVVQNSWGGKWGINGFFLIEANQAEVGIEDSMTYVTDPVVRRNGVIVKP